MDFELNEDERSIQTVFGDFFAKESSVERVREAEAVGFSPELWQALVRTGVPAMGLPASRGGDDATLLDLALVAIEAGRRLAPVPLAEAIAATRLLGRLDGTDGMLARVAAGSALPTLALRRPSDGVARLAPAGAVADLIVALEGDVLIVADGEHRPRPSNLAAAPLGDVPVVGADVVASGENARAVYELALVEWRVLTAAMLSGLQQQALQIGVDYAKTRKVFGIELGWFQTVQHRLAEHAAYGEATYLLALEAAWSAQHDPQRVASLASMAFLANAEHAFATCKDALQFHGGYGFTLEYDIQLYFRRAKAWPLALGPRRDEYQHLAELALSAAALTAGDHRASDKESVNG